MTSNVLFKPSGRHNDSVLKMCWPLAFLFCRLPVTAFHSPLAYTNGRSYVGLRTFDTNLVMASVRLSLICQTLRLL